MMNEFTQEQLEQLRDPALQKSGFSKEQLEQLKNPLLQKTAAIIESIYAALGQHCAIKDIINEENADLEAFLPWAYDLDAPDLQGVEITKDESGLKMKAPNGWHKEFEKGSSYYRAIFWPEIKAEEEKAKGEAKAKIEGNIGVKKAKAVIEAQVLRDDMSPGEINVFTTLYKQRVEAAEGSKEADTTKIKNSLITDIRLNRHLLTETEETDPEKIIANLKDETARRIAAYTTHSEDGWYTLNYKEMKSDKKGLSHEKYVGLGDILLDEDINIISVKREEDEESFTAYRGFTKDGRPCFLTEDDKYVATFTGDQFKIGEDESNKETNPKNPDEARSYMDKIKDTETKSKPYREDIEENGLRSKASYSYENVEIGGESEVGKQKPISEETIIARLNKKREKLGETQDGAEIVAYGQKCAEKYGIPWPIFKELIDVESGWDMGAAYKGPKKSNASGLGQFIGGTWNGKEDDGQGGFVKSREGKAHPPEWGLAPDHQLNRDDRFNPYVMLYATAWLMNQTKEQFHLEGKPLHEQGIIYYLAHHEGPGGVEGYMKLLATIEADGKAAGKTIRTKRDVREQYLENQDKYKALLEEGARNRLEKYGIDDFLSIYFAKAVRIGARAAATDAALVDQIHQKRIESGAVDIEYFLSGDKQLEQRVEKGEAGEGEINEQYFEKNKEGKEFLRAILKVKGGQDRWIFGSSIAVMTDPYRNKPKTGVFGIGGFRSGNFMQVLEQKWPQLEPLEKPKEVILLGLVHNEQERNPQAVMKNYMKIVDFLKSKGINNVKIAIAHEYPGQTSNTIREFNALLRSDKYKEYCLETGVPETAKLHLNADENRKLMTGIENN